MSGPSDPRRRAASDRDAALRRLLRVTQLSVVATLAAGGAFAALAAGSTHAKKLVRAPVRRVTTPSSAVTAAPAPPLVAVQSAAPATPAQTPTPAAPQAAPTPSYQPPVVASGGS